METVSRLEADVSFVVYGILMNFFVTSDNDRCFPVDSLPSLDPGLVHWEQTSPTYEVRSSFAKFRSVSRNCLTASVRSGVLRYKAAELQPKSDNRQLRALYQYRTHVLLKSGHRQRLQEATGPHRIELPTTDSCYFLARGYVTTSTPHYN